MSTANHYGNWQEKVQKFRRNRCVICRGTYHLSLHHYTYDQDNSLFATLCSPCHRKVHFNKGGNKRSVESAAKELRRMLLNKDLKKIDVFKREINRVKKIKVEHRYSKSIDYNGAAKWGSCKP